MKLYYVFRNGKNICSGFDTYKEAYNFACYLDYLCFIEKKPYKIEIKKLEEVE